MLACSLVLQNKRNAVALELMKKQRDQGEKQLTVGKGCCVVDGGVLMVVC
jgi:hypothetical protein